MDISLPQSMVLTETDARVLAILVGTTKPLSGREVARLAEMHQNGVWRTLRRLSEHGLVTEQEAGARTLLYTLNRDHLAAEAVIALARLRARLIQRIKDAIGSWQIRPLHAWLFGSAARGDGSTDSDIDIFVLRPKGIDEEDPLWRSQLSDLSAAVYRWTGNHAGIADISEQEIRRLKKERPPVIDDVVTEGISLYGDSASDVFGRRP